MQKHLVSQFNIAMAVVLFAAPVAHGKYAFTNVADLSTAGPTGTFQFFLPPSINGNTAAFVGGFGTDSAIEGVFTGSGGALTTIAKVGDAAPSGTFDAVAEPSISGGTVAFFGEYGDGSRVFFTGVFTGNGGLLSTIAKSGDLAPTGTFTGVGYGAISGNTTAFIGVYNDGSPGSPVKSGVFTSNGGILSTISKAGDAAPIGQFDSYEWVSISGSKVVFIGDYRANRGVFTSGGGPFTKIVQQGDPIPGSEQTLNLIYLPVISGDTAAFYSYTTVTPGIFTGNGGALATVAREYYYPFLNILSDPAVSGTTVAFLATYLDGNKTLTGLVTKNGGALTSVIDQGDLLFGSAVTELRFGHYGIDSGGSGTLAFAYALADGRRGVAIATPVPEPSTSILSTLALVAVVFRLKASR